MKARMVTQSFRLSEAEKSSWKAWCLAQNTNPGSGLRSVIRKLIATSTPRHKAVVVIESPDATRCRIEVRLTRSEHSVLERLAEERGASINVLLVQVARAFMSNQPALCFDDAQTVRESNERLLALGRNINQLAKSVNVGKLQQIDDALLKQIQREIHAHTQLVSAAVRASTERWEVTWRGL